jgi:excinuclease ABC subunit C
LVLIFTYIFRWAFWYIYVMGIDISSAPAKPGVYLFKASGDRIIYVGKAKNIRNRLRSYFRDSAELDARKAAMVREIRDFSYIVTGNELEAWILEAGLIKQHKPRFNIVLRDDKNYPYIRVTIREAWPRIQVVRRMENDGSLYFGPYIPSQAMWEAIAFIRKNFLIRTCDRSLDRTERPCIQYQMKRCPAPCGGKITPEAYMKIVDDIVLFLKGGKKELMARLEKRMLQYSSEMRYEEAAQVRDSISMLGRVFESQKIIAPELGDLDVIGYFRERGNGRAAVGILFIRNGVMTGAKDFSMEDHLGSEDREVLAGFLRLFYSGNACPAPVILAPFIPSDKQELVSWLDGIKKRQVRIVVPKSGKRRDLLLMAAENARLHFSSAGAVFNEEDAAALAGRFGLSGPPGSIAVFDVSTISGSESVGGMIWWENGEFRKENYRHVKIKWVEGMDDYSMIHETVIRALGILDGMVPDLVVIDGGKGQLDMARRALDASGINTDALGVAKKPDRAFLENGSVIDLSDKNRSSLLLRRLRDEAHRFIITFHRRLRDKRLTESALEKVPGIGRARRLDLLRHFGSVSDIRDASVEEISAVRGINTDMATEILKYLNGGNTE